MMKHKPYLLVAIALLLAMGGAYAQEEEKEHNFNIDLHYLTQGEMRKGAVVDKTTNPQAEDHTNFVVGRTRLILGYQQKQLEMKATIQHSGVWGQGGNGSFNIYEAWAKYTTTKGLFAQIGRQALSYDDQRILGPNDWAMGATSHDVLKMGYEGHGHKVHLLLAYNQNPANIDEGGTFYINGSQPYKTMHTLWYHYNIPKTQLGGSLLFMNIGTQGGQTSGKVKTLYQQLMGTHLSYQPKWGAFSASYYYQSGRDERNVKLAAWMGAVKGSVKASEKVNIIAGFDYLSGDKYFAVPKPGQIGLVQHDKLRGFCSLYGSHHDFYGMMDFFYVTAYVNGFSPGLQNAYGGVAVTPIQDLTIEGYYHYMATATNLQKIDMTLGHIIDISASYQYKAINISAGFSYMTGTDTMEALKRANSNSDLTWGWLCLNITPRVFSVKW